MKKTLYLASTLFCALLLVGIGSGRVYARLTGSGTDAWCVGASGAEVCVDSSGNLVPTTDNDGDLGTSALRFKNRYVAGTVSIPASSIDTDKLAADAVTTTKLINGAVDTAKLAADSVTTAKLLDGAVNTNKIGTAAVTTAKLSTTFMDRKTKAQFDASTPVVGQVALCTDCTIAYSLCVGTGTTLSGWKVSHSATVGCGTNN